MMRGERHHGVADLVHQPIRHGFDEAEIGSLDFQPAQLLALAQILGGEQRGSGHGRIAVVKRQHADFVNRAGRIFRFVAERFQRCAGLEHLINLGAERAGQIAEFQTAGALVLPPKMPPRRLVRVQHFQVAADHHARAAQFPQHIRHHLVIARQLIVQPDVAQREADLFEQMKNQFQLHVHQRFAGHATIENRHADDRVAALNRHRHLRAEQFKFLLRLAVRARLVAVAAENAPQLRDLRADARIQRQFKMFQQSVRETDGRSRAQPPAIFRRHHFRERRARTIQKNRRAIHAQDVAEKLQKLFQHRLRVERMREDRRKIPQHIQRLRRVHEPTARLRIRGRARKNRRVTRRHIRGWTQRGGRAPQTFQHGIQEPLPHRLGQNVRDAVQKCFLLPIRLREFREGENGNFFILPAQPFDAQDPRHPHEFRIENHRAGESVNHERLGFLHIEAMNDAVVVGI